MAKEYIERYRKKPVVVEAIQFTRSNFHIVSEFTGGKADYLTIERCPNGRCYCLVETLEGNMVANEGDYIIKGVHGEFYPCKPDIFEKTYELESTVADVVEVRHGYWTIESEEHQDSVSGEIDEEFYLKCSECGREVWDIDHMTVLHGTDEEIFGNYPYCHCGAKMDKENDNG